MKVSICILVLFAVSTVMSCALLRDSTTIDERAIYYQTQIKLIWGDGIGYIKEAKLAVENATSLDALRVELKEIYAKLLVVRDRAKALYHELRDEVINLKDRDVWMDTLSRFLLVVAKTV